VGWNSGETTRKCSEVSWRISSNLGIGICQAEQKAQEESERLRQQEREQLAERQKNDLV
jgi:hypothetical protein